MLIWCIPAALAGTVKVETTVPVEVRLNTVPVVQTYGAAEIAIPDVPEGKQAFTVFREGKGQPIELDVPAEGTVRLLIGADTLQTGEPQKTEADDKAPKVEIRAAHGQKFAILIDGKRTAVVGHHAGLELETLAVGEHTLEVRTPDNLTVWLRGTLDLQKGDDLILTLQEGKMVEVFGRDKAWIPIQ